MSEASGYAQSLEVLRAADPDRYTSILYLPSNHRALPAALFAFAVEISAIADRVSEPMPGEIRLQWWQEVLRGERDHGGHNVAREVLQQMAVHSLPLEPLLRLVDARVFDLYHDPMPDRNALEAWCGETGSALLQLCAIGMGASASPSLADACGHGGVAMRLTEILLRIGLDRRKLRVLPPTEMLAACGLDAQSWLGDPVGQGHLAVVAAIGDLALEHRAKAVAALTICDPALKPLFLPLATTHSTVAKCRKAGSALFERPVANSPLHRQWLIAKAALFGLV